MSTEHSPPASEAGAGGAAERAAPWTGEFRPYAVGPPGFAAGVRPALAGAASPGNSDVAADEAYVTDSRGTPVVEVRAASVRGRAHRHYGRRRQDSYALERTQDGHYLVLAVADGVSRAEHSHRGARTACLHGSRLLVAELRHCSPRDLDWQAIVEKTAAEVERLGTRAESARDAQGLDFATTLLLAVVGLEHDEHGVLPALVLAVGDSSAWVLRDGSSWEPATALKNDGNDVVENGTVALPAVPRDVGEPVFLGFRPSDALVLMTDGVGDPLGRGTGPVGEFLAARWAIPPTALEFAAHVDFARRSFDDDRTAVAVWALAPGDGPGSTWNDAPSGAGS